MLLASTGELSGSAAITRVPGRAGFNTRATPFSVPPVPKPRHEIVEALISEVVEDLAGRGARVHVRVRLVLELAAEEPAVCLRELDGLREHAAALLGRRRQHDLRAEEAQQFAALDAEALGHGDHEWIALLRAHHREPDAGIAAGRLDDGLARLQVAAPLGILDDGERERSLTEPIGLNDSTLT